MTTLTSPRYTPPTNCVVRTATFVVTFFVIIDDACQLNVKDRPFSTVLSDHPF